jgi:hypothetical protein
MPARRRRTSRSGWPRRAPGLEGVCAGRRCAAACANREGAGARQMAIAITLMVPFQEIDIGAPFSAAFNKFPGWGWASYLVSVGAVFGIGTVLLVRAPWGSLE